MDERVKWQSHDPEKFSQAIKITILCLLPFTLNLMGVDFCSTSKPLPVGDTRNIVIDDLFYRLSGAFTHTLLEWSAFCTALFIFLMSIVHYRISKAITIPVIRVALICAGCMDAFHTLAADRLIDAAADNRNLIPFTWAISRVFNALIMIVGVGILLFRKKSDKKADIPFVIGISILFGVIAYAIIHYCAASTQLPQTMYPDSLITRPWDVGPLLLFVFAGVYVFPKFYKHNPSIFAHSLIICVIPEVAVEMHMAFGSTALFDNHFNIAHFLKIFAYAVPLFGLFMDYIITYNEKEIIRDRLENQTRLLSLIKTISVSANESNSSIEAIQTALEEICRYTGWPVGHAYVKDKARKQLISIGLWHLDDEQHYQRFKEVTDRLFFDPGVDFPGRVYEYSKLHWIDDISKDTNYPRAKVAGDVAVKGGFAFPILVRNETIMVLEFFSKEIFEPDESLLALMTDVGVQLSRVIEREKAEAILNEQKEYYENLIGNLNMPAFVLNTDHKVVIWNKACEELTGLNANDVIGTAEHWKGFYDAPRPLLADIILDKSFELIEEHYPVEGKKTFIPGALTVENLCPMPIKNEPRYLAIDAGPIKDVKGRVVAVVEVLKDISTLKNIQQNLEKRQAELEQSNEELERFAYVASHDLQEPLRMVGSYTSLLALRYKDKLDDDANEFINYAVDGTKRMQILINDLLAFSRLSTQTDKFFTIDCNSLCQEVLGILDISIDEANAVITKDDLPEVKGDGPQLRQLFQNLISNAVKYCNPEDKSKIHISVLKDNAQWVFSITDSGIGIAPEYFETIFIIFKRLHGRDAYSGTGIGLSICKKIVERHGGRIWVESSPGEGSTFSFTIPVM